MSWERLFVRSADPIRQLQNPSCASSLLSALSSSGSNLASGQPYKGKPRPLSAQLITLMFNLMPKDVAFYEQLEHLSEIVMAASDQLIPVLEGWPNFDDTVDKIEAERHEAHILMRKTLWRLDESFITPFDREDIMELANQLYGVIDRIANTSQRLRMYELQNMHPSLRAHAKTLRGITAGVGTIVHNLSHGDKLSDLRGILDAIGQFEEQGRLDRDRFLAELYRDHPDPLEVMKKKELHDLMENAISACDNLGRTLERVLLKND
jgi:uncharacterized protein